MKKIIKVDGMMCQHCVKHVKEALEAIEGVERADVSLETNTAEIYSESEIKDSVIEKAILDAGYTVVKD